MGIFIALGIILLVLTIGALTLREPKGRTSSGDIE